MEESVLSKRKLEEDTALTIKDSYLKQLSDLKIGIDNHENLNIFKEVSDETEYEADTSEQDIIKVSDIYVNDIIAKKILLNHIIIGVLTL